MSQNEPIINNPTFIPKRILNRKEYSNNGNNTNHFNHIKKLSWNQKITYVGVHLVDGYIAVFSSFAAYALDNSVDSTLNYYFDPTSNDWFIHKWLFFIIFTFSQIILNVLIIFAKYNFQALSNDDSTKPDVENIVSTNNSDINPPSQSDLKIKPIEILLFESDLIETNENERFFKKVNHFNSYLNTILDETSDLWQYTVEHYGLIILSCSWVGWVYIFNQILFQTIQHYFPEGTLWCVILMWLRFGYLILVFIIVIIYFVHKSKKR